MEIKSQIIAYNIWYFALLMLGKVALTLYIVLSWLNTYYEISPKRITYRTGIIRRHEDVYELTADKSARVTSIGVQQSFIGRIFNFGTIFFYDRGVYQYYYLHYIHNPIRYFEILHHLVPNADVEKDIIREHIRDRALKQDLTK